MMQLCLACAWEDISSVDTMETELLSVRNLHFCFIVLAQGSENPPCSCDNISCYKCADNNARRDNNERISTSTKLRDAMPRCRKLVSNACKDSPSADTAVLCVAEPRNAGKREVTVELQSPLW